MIGGTDIRIVTDCGEVAMDIAVRIAIKRWPKAVFKNPETRELFTRYADINFAGCSELLIYEDESKVGLWQKLGAVKSLRGTMLYLLISPEELTVVVDSKPPRHISALVSSIKKAIEGNRFLVKGKAA